MQDRTDGRAAALGVYRRLLEAWNDRDAAAFGALFADDGSAVGFDGSPMNGRQEIVSSLKSIFESHLTNEFVARVREVRELQGGVILIRAVAGMAPRRSL